MARRGPRLPGPGTLVEIFLVANVFLVGGDVGLAHASNAYARADEWAPVAFSGLATLLLAPQLFSARLEERGRPLAFAVAAMSILVGVAGMLFHLSSAFFQRQTLHNLVYSAPFIAPLAYVGMGLLLLLNRMEKPGSVEWARWVVFLALGGYVGNLGMSLLDHAQNGFFYWPEWIAVAGAAFGTAFLALLVIRPLDRALLRATLGVLALDALVGLAGFALHTAGNLRRPGTFLQQFLHGAPAFAPLLFADLAALAAIGVWALWRAAEKSTDATGVLHAGEAREGTWSRTPTHPTGRS